MSDLRSDDLSIGAIPALSASSEQWSSGAESCRKPRQFPARLGLGGDAGIDARNGLGGGEIPLLQVDAMPRLHKSGPHPHAGPSDAGIDTRNGSFREFGGIPLLQMDAVPRPHKSGPHTHGPGPPMASCSLEQAYPSVVENLRKFQLSFSPECLGEKAPPTWPFPLLCLPEEVGQHPGLPLSTQPPSTAPQLQNLFSAPAPPFSSHQSPAHHATPQLPLLLNNQPLQPPHSNFVHPPSDFTLPNVPLQPFVPLLITPSQIPPPGKPVLLKLEDPLTKTKENGVKLLSMDIESVVKSPTTVSKAAMVPDQQQQRPFLSADPEPVSESSSAGFVPMELPVEDKKKRKLKSKKVPKRPSERHRGVANGVGHDAEVKPRVKVLDINEGQKQTDLDSSLEGVTSDSYKLSSKPASPLPLQGHVEWQDRSEIQKQRATKPDQPERQRMGSICVEVPPSPGGGVSQALPQSAPEPVTMDSSGSSQSDKNRPIKSSSSESIDFPDQLPPLESLEVRRLHLLSAARSGDELAASAGADKASAIAMTGGKEVEVDSVPSSPPCLDVATPTYAAPTLPPALTPLIYSPTQKSAISGRSLPPPPPPLSSPSPPTLPSPPPPPPAPLSPPPSSPWLITQAVQVRLPSDSDTDVKPGHDSDTGLGATLGSHRGVKEAILTTPTSSIGVQVGFDATPPISLHFSDDVDGDNIIPR